MRENNLSTKKLPRTLFHVDVVSLCNDSKQTMSMHLLDSTWVTSKRWYETHTTWWTSLFWWFKNLVIFNFHQERFSSTSTDRISPVSLPKKCKASSRSEGKITLYKRLCVCQKWVSVSVLKMKVSEFLVTFILRLNGIDSASKAILLATYSNWA